MPTGKKGKRMASGDYIVATMGHWPNINLIMMESADYGAVSDGGTKPSAGASAKRERFLRIHMDIAIGSATTFNKVRDKLAAGKRKDAHAILLAKGALKGGKPRALALIDAALVKEGE